MKGHRRCRSCLLRCDAYLTVPLFVVTPPAIQAFPAGRGGGGEGVELLRGLFGKLDHTSSPFVPETMIDILAPQQLAFLSFVLFYYYYTILLAN